MKVEEYIYLYWYVRRWWVLLQRVGNYCQIVKELWGAGKDIVEEKEKEATSAFVMEIIRLL